MGRQFFWNGNFSVLEKVLQDSNQSRTLGILGAMITSRLSAREAKKFELLLIKQSNHSSDFAKQVVNLKKIHSDSIMLSRRKPYYLCQKKNSNLLPLMKHEQKW